MNTHGRLEKLKQQMNPQGAINLVAVDPRLEETMEEAFERARREQPGGTHFVYTGIPEGTQ